MLALRKENILPIAMDFGFMPENDSSLRSGQLAIPAPQTNRTITGLSYAEHEILRQRKTPNGKLFETDSIAGDNHQPASKHRLLSTAPNADGSQEVNKYKPKRKSSGHNHRKSITWSNGVDSFLYQNLQSQPNQRYYLQHGTCIPTVLPTVLQHQFGPTASAGQEVYGPYWPDGTFSPYRPASVRDLRFSHSDQPPLRKAARYSDLSINNQPHLHNPCKISEPASTERLYQLTTPAFVPGSKTERIAFRDKTFAWANRVYIGLLASIQASRNSQPEQTQPKPMIFPRPPQRSESHVSDFPERKGLLYHSTSRPQTGLQNHAHHRTLSDANQHIRAKEVAIAALNTMELLCEEARTPWIDGMLLVGCLAYGLGQVQKAHDWFKYILAHDGAHIEAMSNLAASLLALNRRDEALQYWTAAVKSRPSYFEAVEHLIGLLCSTNRSKDAITTLEYMESSLRIVDSDDMESETRSHASSIATSEYPHYDYEIDQTGFGSTQLDQQSQGFGTSGYAISGVDNGRMLALIHAKGNMMYTTGNNEGAAAAFEDAIMIATGRNRKGIPGLIQDVLKACLTFLSVNNQHRYLGNEPILLAPEQAETIARTIFPPEGSLPGLAYVHKGMARNAAISTTSNSLLSLAKIYQDSMSMDGQKQIRTRDILALYYLSLSLQRSPSTANNVGILMAGVQHGPNPHLIATTISHIPAIQGVVPGSGVALALAYYNYGLRLDSKHAHLYTNLGSLLKDIGQLSAAVKMYEKAVEYEGTFDIALANLANAVKDQGKISDAIVYYQRAVEANPNFVEAACGLATALNSVCNWFGRGGVFADNGSRDRIHVDMNGQMQQATRSWGWMNRVVEIVDKQLQEGETWGVGVLTRQVIESILQQLLVHRQDDDEHARHRFSSLLFKTLSAWSGSRWEGSRLVRLVEKAIRQIGWQWYRDRYVLHRQHPNWKYSRPKLPTALGVPAAPTVLPFHTFTAPLSAKSVRQISQRNALRISVSTLNMAWLPVTVYPPPPPPQPYLNVGYMSSDFNNHPLAHLMQSIFGLHDRCKVQAICYATSASDGSVHRHKIEKEAPVFHDASAWGVEKLVNQIVSDRVHILVNLNGYTRGARNEVFAARPAPIQMSFMGFAGTLGAEWCDYVLADMISAPLNVLSNWRQNVRIEDRLHSESMNEDEDGWMYGENLIYTKNTFFCVDHKQSAPDAKTGPPPLDDRDACWKTEQQRRWELRKQLFPLLADDVVILGNFNQLYKIDPATFRMYLRILAAVPNTMLWLLRFPELGEQNLREFARLWAGDNVASRIVFTDVAPKGTHIIRASVVDLFLDTPECNAHTTAADVVWSGSPILTWGKWDYKMCSRIAGSIMNSAFGSGPEHDLARKELIVRSEAQFEEHAIKLATGLKYSGGFGSGRLNTIRRMLWEGRWTSPLFDTARWVRDLERAYASAWRNYVEGEGGDIWL